jgi:hypothetical protein
MGRRRRITQAGAVRQEDLLGPRASSDLTLLQQDLSTAKLTVTGVVQLPVLTTTQRNALTAAAGMMVYNTTDSKFQGYDGSAWRDLH